MEALSFPRSAISPRSARKLSPGRYNLRLPTQPSTAAKFFAGRLIADGRETRRQSVVRRPGNVIIRQRGRRSKFSRCPTALRDMTIGAHAPFRFFLGTVGASGDDPGCDALRSSNLKTRGVGDKEKVGCGTASYALARHTFCRATNCPFRAPSPLRRLPLT